MPPWKADPHYGKWSNDPTLSQAEIEKLKSWVDGGAPEGDPKTMPPMPVVLHRLKSVSPMLSSRSLFNASGIGA